MIIMKKKKKGNKSVIKCGIFFSKTKLNLFQENIYNGCEKNYRNKSERIGKRRVRWRNGLHDELSFSHYQSYVTTPGLVHKRSLLEIHVIHSEHFAPEKPLTCSEPKFEFPLCCCNFWGHIARSYLFVISNFNSTPKYS